MPIIIIHGNGLSGISNKIRQIKTGYDSLSFSEFSGKTIQFNEVVLSLSTPALFTEKRLAVLEDFEPQEIQLDQIPKDSSLTTVVKFSKNLASSCKLIKEASLFQARIIVINEEDEKNIFPFLDKVADKNFSSLNEIDKLYEDYGYQYLLIMIFYMLRRLVLSPAKLPAFVQQKINRQKKNFDYDRIGRLYHEALETDYKVKNGLLDEKIGLTMLINKILSL